MSISDIAERTAELNRERCRRLILEALAADANYTLSFFVLRGLLADYDCPLIETDRAIEWLATNGMIRIDSFGPGGVESEATLTARGEDVSAGRSSVSGVARMRKGL